MEGMSALISRREPSVGRSPFHIVLLPNRYTTGPEVRLQSERVVWRFVSC